MTERSYSWGEVGTIFVCDGSAYCRAEGDQHWREQFYGRTMRTYMYTMTAYNNKCKQDAQLSQRDRAAG